MWTVGTPFQRIIRRSFSTRSPAAAARTRGGHSRSVGEVLLVPPTRLFRHSSRDTSETHSSGRGISPKTTRAAAFHQASNLAEARLLCMNPVEVSKRVVPKCQLCPRVRAEQFARRILSGKCRVQQGNVAGFVADFLGRCRL